MASPYLTEDGETLLTEDGNDTLILEQDDTTTGGTRRIRHMAALLRARRSRTKK